MRVESELTFITTSNNFLYYYCRKDLLIVDLTQTGKLNNVLEHIEIQFWSDNARRAWKSRDKSESS